MSLLQLNKEKINNLQLVDVNSTFKEEQTFSITEDIVFVGPRDGGEDLSYIDKLIEARNNGKTIVFTHDNPKPRAFTEIEDDTKREKAEAVFIQKLKDNFGIDYFGNKDYKFSKKGQVLDASGLAKGLKAEINIQETHTTNIFLKSGCDILINFPNIENSKNNFYLATFKEVGKGLVVFWNIGHCDYKDETIKNLTLSEKVILGNLMR